MKTLISFLLLIAPSLGFAGTCSWYDQLVEFNASIGRLEPSHVTVREGDRLCVRLTALDKSYNVMVQGFPVWLQASKSRSDEASFSVNKVGTFSVTCSGCGAKASLVVLPKKDFDKKSQKLLERESILNRRYNYK